MHDVAVSAVNTAVMAATMACQSTSFQSTFFPIAVSRCC